MLKLIAITTLCTVCVLSIKNIVYAFENLKVLRHSKKHPDSVEYSQSVIFNKKTGKLENNNSIILPN